MRAADTIWRPARCQWIHGEPTADDACKCGAPVQEDSPYCPDHAAKSRQRERARDVVEQISTAIAKYKSA